MLNSQKRIVHNYYTSKCYSTNPFYSFFKEFVVSFQECAVKISVLLKCMLIHFLYIEYFPRQNEREKS